MIEKLSELKKEHEVLEIFCELAQIPSPSLKEEKVVEWIKDFCQKNSINFRQDDYGNVCILGNDYPKYYLNQRNAKLEIISDLERLYLSYLLKFPEIKSRLTNISRGIRQANIANKDIENLQIPVPPLSLQNQFAAFVQQIDKSKFEYTNTGAAA